MRFAAVLLTVLLAALAAGCGNEGKKGEFRNQDRPRRGDTKASTAHVLPSAPRA
jgi:hypothetical protein